MEAAQAQVATSVPNKPGATIEQWLAIPIERRAALIDGEIVYQALPGPRPGRIQGRTFSIVGPPFDRRSGGELPGGWWFSLEGDMEIGGHGVPARCPWLAQGHPFAAS